MLIQYLLQQAKQFLNDMFPYGTLKDTYTTFVLYNLYHQIILLSRITVFFSVTSSSMVEIY